MKAKLTTIAHVVKEAHTIVVLDDESKFEMCGEIIDDVLDQNSVEPAFSDFEDFDTLSQELRDDIVKCALAEFLQFC